MSICTQSLEKVFSITFRKAMLSSFSSTTLVLMEILVAAAVFIPFSALVMNAFSGDSEDDFDFL